MSRTLKSLLVFTGTGLLGPLVRFAAWPPSTFNTLAPKSVSNFLYDFVLLLWPTQPMAAVEVNIGKAAAAAVAIGANLLLFAILGVAVGTFGKSRTRLISAYVVVCGLIFWFDLWGAGFSFSYLNAFALVLALLLYAIPFWVVSGSVMHASAMPKSA
ncbi:MAG: hypothetical protein WBD45_14025 [Terriglobales bacterium]